jgi:hypothetical protein
MRTHQVEKILVPYGGGGDEGFCYPEDADLEMAAGVSVDLASLVIPGPVLDTLDWIVHEQVSFDGDVQITGKIQLQLSDLSVRLVEQQATAWVDEEDVLIDPDDPMEQGVEGVVDEED